MKNNINKQQTVLYEFNDMTNVIFLPEDEFPAEHKILTHKLEYFKKLDGEYDVIRYSRCNKENIVSYYTIRNGIALCGLMKDGQIDWNYMEGMTNYVATRFMAFQNNGIELVSDELKFFLGNQKFVRTRNR